MTWADVPLATAEVAAIAELDLVHTRVELGCFADPIPAGAGFYWSRGLTLAKLPELDPVRGLAFQREPTLT